ncbi:protein of unknown function [Magnetospirillum sp. XM-1]|nr:protein of unknown function [Magnetospirillum sp. XM-1]
MCLQDSTAAKRQAPLISLCQPIRCPNACITERHRPAWTRAAADAEDMLREKRLAEPQRVALRQDLERFRAILDAISPCDDVEISKDAKS